MTDELYSALFLCIKISLILITVFVVSLVLKKILSIVKHKTSKTKNIWDDMLYKSLGLPLRTLVWFIAVYLILHLLMQYFTINGALSGALSKASSAMFIAIFFWFVFRVVNGAEVVIWRHIGKMENMPIDKTGLRALKRILQIFVLMIIVIVVMGLLQIPITGILTFGGVSSLVFAYAAKDALANFFSGLMLYFQRHFVVGDWIYSPDRKIEGTVENIGWRVTRIRGFDKRPIYVSNSILNDIVIVNATRMSNRRIQQNIGLRYDDAAQIPMIFAKIREMLATHPEIDQEMVTLVNLIGFESSSITFMIYTFTKTTLWAPYQLVQDDVLLKTEAIIRECGAECAFPTTTLHIANMDKDKMDKGLQDFENR